MSHAHSTPATPAPWSHDALVIGLIGLAHGSSHFGHLLLPLLFPVFATEFHLSFTALGSLMTVFFLVSGLGQAVSGFLVDRWGARPLLYGSMVLFILACIVAAGATGYQGLLIVAILAGLANASFHPVDFTILSHNVSAPRLGYAFSVHGLTGNLGWALAPVFFASMGAWVGWRYAYWIAALLFIAILGLLLLMHTHLAPRQATAPPHTSDSHTVLQQVSSLFSRPVIWWSFGFFLLSTMTLSVVQTYGLSLLNHLAAVPLSTATNTLTAFMLAGAVGMLIGGWLAGREQANDRIIAWCFSAGAVLLAVCATGWLPSGLFLVVFASVGFSIGIAGPSRDLLIKKSAPPGAIGRVYGLVYCGLDTGFAISPLLFGLLMDRGWYQATLLGAAMILLLSMGAALGVGRRGLVSPPKAT